MHVYSNKVAVATRYIQPILNTGQWSIDPDWGDDGYRKDIGVNQFMVIHAEESKRMLVKFHETELLPVTIDVEELEGDVLFEYDQVYNSWSDFYMEHL